ncbi:uncharacterized protein [Montipora capricornis]|uniref:uncharacterized protein n=1 Tax=Montipora capricornis TaxID=246305 RepID=UPI0035F1DBAF
MADPREEKHLQRLKDLHSAGRYSPNHLDQMGLCHIHHATLRGYLQCAKWLYKHGSSLTVRSAEGSVPAHYAASGGHLECLKWIHRKASKSICMTDFNGATPLYFSEGHLNCLEWLAKHSGTVHWETSRDGTTAVHVAAVEGHLECLAFLLGSAGCRALARDRAANTLLHYAAACGRRHCVDWLLSNTNSLGNERNKNGSSPLHLAAQNGHLEVVKLMVKRGVAIKLRDRLGRTPFNVAVSSGNEACAQFLRQAEANNEEAPYLKRVRFEAKAIERDFDSEEGHQHGQFAPVRTSRDRGRFPQKSYSLYRNQADVTVEGAMDRFAHAGSTQLDNRHMTRVPQRHLKSHVTTTSFLPWSRVYKMTQSTDAIRSHQSVVYAPSDNDDHQKSSGLESTSSQRRSSSFLSKIVSRKKSKELFPADVNHFDDMISSNSKESNVLKRLYRLSKEKLTKSYSFAVENMAEGSSQIKKSIVVSGNDDFIARSTTIPSQDYEQGEQINRQREHLDVTSPGSNTVEETSVAGVNKSRNIPTKCSDGKKTRKRISVKEIQEIATPRDNSMIW